ncbi:imidazolonepropionase [Mesorhizobium soli]|uniref:imidazolonepropionase n=1 Tax=Pseudaminobacter soli (ex Li et al. 2025) TaxID=1295366 RepID=UPI00247543DE|nr:imidazolonepropionase [Mesorhizobium soli]MDH6232244.1 imidazolonepropionase [Mesorhizobium soli]
MDKITALVENAGQVLTCASAAPDLVGARTNTVVAISGNAIAAIGTPLEIAAKHDLSGAARINADGGLVMPGFVDCHTHLVFHKSRVEEYAQKVRGRSAAEIKAMGIPVGITATARMMREASKDQLLESAAERLQHMLACGTTTVESKSGYGLNTATEIKMLEVNRLLGQHQPIEVVSTFLGAHEFPDDKSREAYIAEILDEMIPEVARRGLAEFNDVYCDDGYYTVAESRTILERGREYGLGVKIHTDAYSHIGGSALAAELQAVSADHMNFTAPEEYAALRDGGVVCVVMPALDFAVGHSRPFDARAMLDAGITLALATDMCPGCWLESMPFVIQLACRLYKFSPAEAIRAGTLHAARALNRGDRIGSLEAGKQADIAIFPYERYEDMAYRLGRGRARLVMKAGKVVFDEQEART